MIADSKFCFFIQKLLILWLSLAIFGMAFEILRHIYMLIQSAYWILAAHKTTSWVDVWSIQHGLSGFLLMAVLTKMDNNHHASIKTWLIFLIFLYLWEMIELQLELGNIHPAITYWMQGLEHPFNRWVFDTIIAMIGAKLFLIGQIKERTIWNLRKVSIGFVGLHILVFSHCMAISDYLTK